MYCTITDVRELDIESITTSLSDSYLNTKIGIASDMIDDITQNHFDKRAEIFYNEDIDIVGDTLYFVSPIVSITTVIDNGTGLTNIKYKVGDIKLKITDWTYSNYLEVHGYFGYNTVPKAILQATALLVLFLISEENNLDSKDIKSEKMDFASISYFQNSGYSKVPSQIMMLLQKYKRTVLGTII